LKADKNFEQDFNVIGLSQGGLHARYVVENCDTKGRAKNLITLGGPHAGKPSNLRIKVFPPFPIALKDSCVTPLTGQSRRSSIYLSSNPTLDQLDTSETTTMLAHT
jgi:hypothetical protein